MEEQLLRLLECLVRVLRTPVLTVSLRNSSTEGIASLTGSLSSGHIIIVSLDIAIHVRTKELMAKRHLRQECYDPIQRLFSSACSIQTATDALVIHHLFNHLDNSRTYLLHSMSFVEIHSKFRAN